jgi:hypothetical protein
MAMAPSWQAAAHKPHPLQASASMVMIVLIIV